MLGLSMSQSPMNATSSVGLSGLQSKQPVEPIRSRKRYNEVLSPAKAPPASYQKVSSPQGQPGSVPNPSISSVGYPVRSSVALPITDLFACDIDLVPVDHDVYIGNLTILEYVLGLLAYLHDDFNIGICGSPWHPPWPPAGAFTRGAHFGLQLSRS